MSRRTGCRFITLLLVTVCICGCTRVSSGPVPLECGDLTGPVWVGLVPFEIEEDSGWSAKQPARTNYAPPPKLLPLIGKNRRLTIADRSFDTDLPTGIRIHSAASHDACGYLTVVSAKARVFLLRRQGNWYVTAASWSAEKPSTVLRTRFSFVPGLVYLLCDDDALAEELRYDNFTQRDSDFTQRVALTDLASQMHGIPWAEREEQPLAAAYRVDDSLTLHLSRWRDSDLVLALPEPLGAPHRSAPMDELDEAVFRIQDHGILCHTTTGWAMFSFTGEALGFFPFPQIRAWTDPVVRGNALYVIHPVGPSSICYRLDIRNGKAIEEALPPHP